MSPFLRFAHGIDALNERVGRAVGWLVLAAVVISAVNAAVRKAFNYSSNAFLEIQWYLFAGVFLLGAGYTLLRQEHVRIDVLLSKFSRRTQVKVELFGFVVFLAPFVLLVLDLGFPFFLRALNSGEMSASSGGLIRWPAYLLIPVGFALLGLQGVSEFIKRLAFLAGKAPDPGMKTEGKTAEEELAEFLRAQQEAAK
ncbi:TRAP transporter small permease subunit [Derxia gummosa]|uniref:TRAP transporter small permease protein n=1 Tax=Derxia gummosa DSM 723 TaxID=1121388 RepID=A0A8B6X472_9BURK|nr:TRAP transporter small permease subunit [Derxia gummosa]